MYEAVKYVIDQSLSINPPIVYYSHWRFLQSVGREFRLTLLLNLLHLHLIIILLLLLLTG